MDEAMEDQIPNASECVANVGVFLDLVVARLSWRNLQNEIIFDVGCGIPRIKMAELLVNRFPELHIVEAIDNRPLVIRYLRWKHEKRWKHENRLIEYCIADIENWSDIARFEGMVDKVISTHTFHLLSNQVAAFQNIYRIMKRGGHAAFLFCLESGYADWFTHLLQNMNWNRYYNFQGRGPANPVTQNKNLSSAHYEGLLTSVGFTVLLCNKKKTYAPYRTDEDCKKKLQGVCNFSFDVPDELLGEFHNDIFETFINCNGRDDSGKPCQISYYIFALVIKPMHEGAYESMNACCTS